MDNLGEAVCCSCGQRFATTNMVAYGNAWVCAACKPGFFQRIQQGESPHVGIVYGGFGERFVAKLIDGILMYLVQMPLNLALGISLTGQAPKDPALMSAYLLRVGLSTVISLTATLAFTVFFLGRFGATPGKMALKLKVVRPGGESVSYAQAAARYLGEIVSMFTCYVGYVIAAFDVEKRALHDRIAGTRVIKGS